MSEPEYYEPYPRDLFKQNGQMHDPLDPCVPGKPIRFCVKCCAIHDVSELLELRQAKHELRKVVDLMTEALSIVVGRMP